MPVFSPDFIRFASSIFVAGGIAYALSRTGQFSGVQIAEISIGAAIFLFIYGQVTHHWYLRKSQNRTHKGIIKQRARVALGIGVIAMFVLTISGGVQDQEQFVAIFLLLLLLLIVWVLSERANI